MHERLKRFEEMKDVMMRKRQEQAAVELEERELAARLEAEVGEGMIRVGKLDESGVSSKESLLGGEVAASVEVAEEDQENSSCKANAMEGAGRGEAELITDRELDPDDVIKRANEKIKKIDSFKKKANVILADVRGKLD